MSERQETGGPQCEHCGEPIEGDIMKPENHGPMHADCWTEWIHDQ